jgi:N-acetylglucosamine kinase-like BadF-type ATPase
VRDVFLAVDAGNTKTWAGLTTADGELLGVVRGGIGDIYAPAGAEAATSVVLGLVRDLLHGAGLEPADVRHSAFRLAGVDWPEDTQYWTGVLRQLFTEGSFSVKNDGFALIRSGRLDGQGISVVLGTGAAIAGRGPTKEWALSWWLQHPLGAAGLVSEALRAVYLSQLGLAEPTKLSAVLPPLFGTSTAEEMLEATTRRGNSSTFAVRAAYAPAVLDLIDDDPVVAGLVDTQAERIADYVLSLVTACGLSDVATVVVGGGLVREPGAPLFAALRRTCERRGLTLDLQHTQDPALVGALLDAIAEGGATPTDAARRRLSAAPW